MDIKNKDSLRKEIPPGTKVKLIKFNPSEPAVPPGTIGTVVTIDDACQIHVRWETGSALAIIPEVDEFEII